ncbi:MAG: hypothetical protein O2897_04640 [bacterium]|nr:hypothetical protein [bacterium]
MRTIMNTDVTSAFRSFTATTDTTPGIVDASEARELIAIAKDVYTTSCCGASVNRLGQKELKKLFKENPTKFNEDAKGLISYYLTRNRLPPEMPDAPALPSTPSTPTEPAVVTPTSPVAPVDTVDDVQEKLLGKWKCAKETWHCHWFPMKATRPGGDPINNLYARGGSLDLYDQAFGTVARKYESDHNSKPHDAGEEFSWWGFCNLASEAAAVLEQPIFEVARNGITFSPDKMSGLLVKVVPSLVSNVSFSGERYNGPSDNLEDPKPAVFMTEVLQKWGYKADNPKPMILDIDRATQVWNYPYDQGEVYESKTAPEGFDAATVPTTGTVKYYRVPLEGTGFAKQKREYNFWIQYSGDGRTEEMLESDWIHGADEKISPDFAWQPHANGDLTKPEAWVTNERMQSNPHVLAEEVYSMYMESIGRGHDVVASTASNTPATHAVAAVRSTFI